ncbi:MAG TPA: hypothetical protein DCF62_06390 [Porticoccaceae bacterium]|nr:hypothetical protein [Porticoccaceae bacterium]HCO61252.1 hypothetical protein [Porticoccaceae bacterium]
MSGSSTTQLYGRMNQDGTVAIEDEDGNLVTRIEADVYPVGSDQTARHEHPEGISLLRVDAAKLGVILEGV